MQPALKPFSCYIIAETLLAQECGEQLLERGHTIHGIITPNLALRQWADERGIACCDDPADMEAFLRRQPFQYLFSIDNNAVLSERILSRPCSLAVNYHDALLPHHGGMHAPSWAIMQREPVHGITWHMMTPRNSAGAVLKQRTFNLDDRETAASLSLKCCQAAVAAFAELIDELAAQTAVARPQAPSLRTFMPRHRRPPAGCLIDWNSDARDIDALVRALDFGPLDNPLGVAKTILRGSVLVVGQAALLEQASGALPGTVLSVTEDDVRVATGTLDLSLGKLTDLDGAAYPVSRLQERCRIAPGARLWSPDEGAARVLTEVYDRLSPGEPFWLERLGNLAPAVLPDMRLRAAQPTERLRIFRRGVPARLLGTAGELVDAGWMAVCGLFTAFLARHTGVARFDVGLQAGGQLHLPRECTELVTDCVPLRCACDSGRSMREHLRGAAAQITRTLGQAPRLRDMAVRYPALAGGLPRMPVAVVRVESMGSVALSIDVDVALVVTTDGLEYRLVVNAAAVDAGYACSLDRQFGAFVAAASESLDTAVERMPLVSPVDEQEIVYGWNDTARDFDRGICIHQLFEQQVQRQPDAVATVQDGSSWTYRELNRRANRIARHLIVRGVRPGMLVGICLERCHDMIAGLLGILKAGAAYVPLECAFPPGRIAMIVRTADLTTVLTQASFKHLLAGTGVATVLLDQDSARIDGEAAEPDLPSCSAASDIAYVVYTSGSTGTPKGIEVAHRAAVNLFEWAYRTCGFSARDTVLFVTALSFDLSVFDIFGMLGCGATIHIATDRQRQEPRYLAQMLCEGDVSFWDSAPAALQLVLPLLQGWPRPIRNRQLRLVFLSGDWIPMTMPDDIRQVFPAAACMALGGATEATVWSNSFDVNVVEPVWRSIPYGRPIQNSRYYVLDAHHAVCPPGVAGDLYIAGECLSNGYFKAPELTDQSFVSDPFHPGEVMYRTGDLARFYPDGTIEFLGREDFQVKVRGFRIELGEIEHVLRRYPTVKEAIAVACEDSGGAKKLIAYIVPAAAATPTAWELREFAAKYLADYMVPNEFVQLLELPVNANGKLDRSRLPRTPATLSMRN